MLIYVTTNSDDFSKNIQLKMNLIITRTYLAN